MIKDIATARRIVRLDYDSPHEPRNYRDPLLRLALWEFLTEGRLDRVTESGTLWQYFPQDDGKEEV